MWQVGIMLNDLIIDSMVIGGPAYKCKQLDRGDKIIKVDGYEVDENNFQAMLLGDDIPGSFVILTVLKEGSEEVYPWISRGVYIVLLWVWICEQNTCL
jgi:C-terminal processing protease CtpA/Prc